MYCVCVYVSAFKTHPCDLKLIDDVDWFKNVYQKIIWLKIFQFEIRKNNLKINDF